MRARIKWIAATLAGLVVGASCASARAAGESFTAGLKLDGGFQEIVISVPDLEQAVTFYQKVAGWRVIQRGASSPEMLAAWQLPETAKAIEAVLQNPGDPSGFVRLVKFRGVAQEESRPSARLWEPGGIAGFDLRARDVQSKYLQLRAFGWHGYSQPVQFQLERFTAIAAIMQGPSDEAIGLLQRVDPPLGGFPNLKELSYAFNTFATVRDFDATIGFYTDKLGFKVFLRDEGAAATAGRNLFGLPHNLVNNVYRRIAWVHPKGDVARDDHVGSMAFMTFYGAQGEDFTGRAKAPNLGIIAVRFPVSDADARAEELKAKGVTLEYEPTEVGIAPYGAVTVFGLRDPNGALIEFFEPDDKP